MQIELKLRYIQGWTDELGRKRYRFRRKGFPGVELPVNGDPASPEFQAAYHAALRGERQDHALAMVAARGGSGTVKDAIERYLNSTAFRTYSPGTQGLRGPILKTFLRPGVGNLPLAKMDSRYIERWLETAPTMGAKRTRLLALKPFMQWAVTPMGLIEVDPTTGIKVKVKASDGHATWTDEQIAQFRARHPIGSKARLALELLLGVALRRGDGISLGRQHVKNGWLVYTQEKNKRRKQFRVWCNEAGLPECCVPHGLRKGGSKLMGDSGCTAHEIMAVTGHRTLKEVQRYTEAYDRKTAAARAQRKVAEARAEPEAASNVVPLPIANR